MDWQVNQSGGEVSAGIIIVTAKECSLIVGNQIASIETKL